MQLIRGYQQNHFKTQPIAATIGNFDGVHLGHQALIKHLKQEAAARNLPTAVILFEPQPAEFFQQQNAPARLYTLREKIRNLKQLGVEYIICLSFDKDLALTDANHFATHILFEKLHVRYLLTGEDFRFGYQRQGDFSTLCRFASEHGVEVTSFNDYLFKNHRVSSTSIRKALQVGDFDAAEKLLGRAYAISGRVIHGAKRGRQWGIPTANIKLSHIHVPLKGVYDVWVIKQDGHRHPAVANLGRRPTVDGSQYYLEVHVHHFEQSLYGERLRVVFLHKRRDEIKFDNVDDLISQIHKDIQESEMYFANHYDSDLKE